MKIEIEIIDTITTKNIRSIADNLTDFLFSECVAGEYNIDEFNSMKIKILDCNL